MTPQATRTADGRLVCRLDKTAAPDDSDDRTRGDAAATSAARRRSRRSRATGSDRSLPRRRRRTCDTGGAVSVSRRGLVAARRYLVRFLPTGGDQTGPSQANRRPAHNAGSDRCKNGAADSAAADASPAC